MPTPPDLQALLRTHPLFTRSRLTSLYSDFRPLIDTNPDGYSANIAAWLSLLTDATRHGLTSSSPSSPDTFVLTANAALISSLATEKEGRPLAIGAVISESLRSKALIPLSTFLTQPDSIYTSKSYISALSTWVLSRLPLISTLAAASTPTITETTLARSTTPLVVVSTLEDTARSLLSAFAAAHTGPLSELHTIQTFLHTFPNPLTNAPFSDTDLRVLLTFLERDLHEITTSPTTQTIKLRPPTSPSPPTSLTQTDITTAALKSTIHQASLSLTTLTTSSAALASKAKSLLAANNKPGALAALRTKKLVDTHIATRTQGLHQLETVLYQLDAAASNAELVALLDSGGAALGQLNRAIGGVDRVEEVLEKVREAGEDAEEIQRVLNTGMGQEGWVDEGEVEGELDRMLEEEGRRRRERGVEEYERRAREAEEKARREAEELAVSLGGLELVPPGGDVHGVGGREREKEREGV